MIDQNDTPHQIRWTKERLCKDFWRGRGWIGFAVCLPIGIIAGALAVFVLHEWKGAAAGFCALLVILTGFYEYFVLPPPGAPIKAPNWWLRISAGILALLSAVLWILDGIPDKVE